MKRVAETYLTKDNRSVASIVRKAGKSASADPDLVGLTPEQLPVIRRIIGTLAEEKSVEKLRERLKGVEAQLAKADAKSQPFLKILKKKTAERIAELEKK